MNLLWRVTSPLAHRTGLRHRRVHSVGKGGNLFYIHFFWAGTTLEPEVHLLSWAIRASLSGGQMEQALQWDDRTAVTARRWWKVCKHHSDNDANLSGCQKYCFRQLIPNPVTIIFPPGRELGLLIPLYHTRLLFVSSDKLFLLLGKLFNMRTVTATVFQFIKGTKICNPPQIRTSALPGGSFILPLSTWSFIAIIHETCQEKHYIFILCTQNTEHFRLKIAPFFTVCQIWEGGENPQGLDLMREKQNSIAASMHTHLF